MQRHAKIRETWDETGSENEDSTSYNIPLQNLSSSGDENPGPRSSQYKREKLVKMLEHMRDQPSSDEESDNEEGHYIFSPHLEQFDLSNYYTCFDVICFKTGDCQRWRTPAITMQYWCSHGDVQFNGERIKVLAKVMIVLTIQGRSCQGKC